MEIVDVQSKVALAKKNVQKVAPKEQSTQEKAATKISEVSRETRVIIIIYYYNKNKFYN